MLHSITREKLLFPIRGEIIIPLMLGTSILGSLLQPGKVRTIAVTSILGYLAAEVMANPIDKLAEDALLPIQSIVVFSHWISFYLLHTPEKEYMRVARHKSRHDKINDGDRVKEIGAFESATTWWDKLRWVTSLKMTLRGVGWNWEVKNIPPKPSQTKWEYVRSQLLKASVFYIFFDLIWYSLQFSVYGSPHPPSLLSNTPTRQVFFGWIAGLTVYFTANIPYPIFAAITVASGVYEPYDWPPLMGKLKDVITVRDLWGKFWHQCLRRTLNVPFDALTKLVPLKKGTFASRYSQLYLAFIASALLHHYPLLRSGAGNYSTLTYFLIQPLAITCEDLAIHLSTKAGIRSSWKTRTIGRIWTFTWFSFSLRYGADNPYSDGILAEQQMPSLCKFLAGSWGWLPKTSGTLREL